MIAIQKIELPLPGLQSLQSEAKAEGYEFIETLVQQWANAENRFDGPGETLCGHLEQGVLVAVGALSIDPFAGRLDTGRIRKVYVRPAWRKRGIGRALVTSLVDQARTRFRCVRLRAENANAGRLYESIGFAPLESPDATHILIFNPQD